MIGAQEVGEIIPFSAWMIPFPVFKTRFELVGGVGGEKLILKLASASNGVGVEAWAELGNIHTPFRSNYILEE